MPVVSQFDRLIFTVARGGAKYRDMALGLGRSMRLIGETIPTAVLTDIDADWKSCFDVVIRPEAGRTALDKLLALDVSPAAQVVALDCDSLVFRPLSPVFDYCAGMPFAVQGDGQSSGTWHGAKVEDVCRRFGRDRIPYFNGGFLYYERQPETARLFEAMREAERNYGESGFGDFRGRASEEVCVLLGMLGTGIGGVIPDETDFMSTAVGLIGSLRMDVREARCEFLCRRRRVRHIRPYVFHASRYSSYLIYWRQLARLRKLFTS